MSALILVLVAKVWLVLTGLVKIYLSQAGDRVDFSDNLEAERQERAGYMIYSAKAFLRRPASFSQAWSLKCPFSITARNQDFDPWAYFQGRLHIQTVTPFLAKSGVENGDSVLKEPPGSRISRSWQLVFSITLANSWLFQGKPGCRESW